MGVYTDESTEYGIRLISKLGEVHHFAENNEKNNEKNNEENMNKITWKDKLNDFLQQNKDEEFIILAFLYNITYTLMVPFSMCKCWCPTKAYIYGCYRDNEFNKDDELVIIKNNIDNRRSIAWPETRDWFIQTE